MKAIIIILIESISFAIHELKVNKTRAFLTLSGITIGIFCITSVFSVVDSMKKNINESIENLGSNVLYIQKWPWEFSTDFEWWKYVKRPIPTLDELKEIQLRSKTTEHAVFVASTMSTVEYGEFKSDNSAVMGVSDDYHFIQPIDFSKGRYFTPSELNSGANVAIIGSVLSQHLFGNSDPIEKSVRIFNQKVKIIGVIAHEGKSDLRNSHDESVIVPVQLYRRIKDFKDESTSNTMIMIKVKPDISNIQAIDELTGILRAARKLKPTTENSFSINEASLISKGFEDLFSIVSIAGWLIGSFSLLVGGFGIANIMFVSVSERTRIIGIQKAIGAKSHFILFQYLTESVVLSVLGGFAGLVIVVLLTLLISVSGDFAISVSTANVVTAFLISSLIGVISGLAPAFKASRLDPVEAIRK